MARPKKIVRARPKKPIEAYSDSDSGSGSEEVDYLDPEFQNSDAESGPESEVESVDSETDQEGGEDDDIDEIADVDVGDETAESLDIDEGTERDPNDDSRYDPVLESDEFEDDTEPETDEEIAEVENEMDAEAETEAELDDITEEEHGQNARICHLRNLNKDFIALDEDDSHMYGKLEYKLVPKELRETDPILTYYEMVRIIGTRAQQFNFGAPPLVTNVDHLSSPKKAYVELMAKMTPYIIRRHLPGKKFEEWNVAELEIIHEIDDSFFVPENFELKTK